MTNKTNTSKKPNTSKKTNVKRAKELQVADLYAPQTPQTTSVQKSWFSDNKEVLAVIITIILAACGVCYKMGQLEAEFRENIKNANQQVSTLIQNQQQTTLDITNIKIEIGKHQTELNFLKERKTKPLEK